MSKDSEYFALNHIPIDKDGDEYKRRIQHLLDKMKRERWDVELNDAPKTKRGRKPKPIVRPTGEVKVKRVDKFFKWDDL